MPPLHTHLIWDFNGTILEDMALGIRCTNEMLGKRGLPPIPSIEAYREIFGFPIEDYYRRLGFDFQKEDYETCLAPEWVSLYLAGEDTCPLIPGVLETIRRVRELGIPQILLSATHREMLNIQLKHLGLEGEFEEVIGLDNIHARSKREQAMAWRQRHPEAHPLFLGDTEHDAQVAEAVGGDCVLFVGGHQSHQRLKTLGRPLITELQGVIPYL